MKVSRTGKLTKRLTIFIDDLIKDENGDYVEGEKILTKCWAEIDRYSVNEFRYKTENEIEGIKKRKNHLIFKIRHRQKIEIDTTMKVEYQGKNYEIKEIQPDDRDQEFDLISVVLIE